MQTRLWPLSGVIFTAIAWLSPAHAVVPDGHVVAPAAATANDQAFESHAAEPAPALMSEAGAPREFEDSEPGDGSALYEEEQIADEDPSALTDFKQELQPYGRWVTTPTYGTVWVPHKSAVGQNFKPYVSRGRWSLTSDSQWLWVSEYPFGSVVFHYGRWVWANRLGWSWVPGRQYSHAWVAFRVSSDPFIGWGPLPPSFIWRRGVAVSLRRPPVPYVFAPRSRIFHRSLRAHVVWQPQRVRNLLRRSHYYRPVRTHRRNYAQATRRYQAVRRGPLPRDVGVRASRSRVRSPNARALGFRRYRRARDAAASNRVRPGARRAALATRRNRSRADVTPRTRVRRSVRRNRVDRTERSNRSVRRNRDERTERSKRSVRRNRRNRRAQQDRTPSRRVRRSSRRAEPSSVRSSSPRSQRSASTASARRQTKRRIAKTPKRGTKTRSSQKRTQKNAPSNQRKRAKQQAPTKKKAFSASTRRRTSSSKPSVSNSRRRVTSSNRRSSVRRSFSSRSGSRRRSASPRRRSRR